MRTNQVGINLETMTLKLRKEKRQNIEFKKDDQKDDVSGKNQKYCK